MPRERGVVRRRGLLAAVSVTLGVAVLLAIRAQASAVEPIPTTTTVVVDPDPAYYHETVLITATVSPNPGDGIVRISSAGGVFDLPIDPDTGTASVSDELFNNPSAVSAHFFGTDAYAASSSAVSWITVNSVTTTTALEIAPNPSLRRDAVTFTATVTPIPAGGDIAFWTTTGTLLGIEAVSPVSGEATLVRSDLAAGTRLVWASFSGSGRYRASSSFLSPVSHQVKKRPMTLTLAPAMDPSPASPVSFDLELSAVPYAGTLKVIDSGGQIVAMGLASTDGTGTTLLASVSLSEGLHALHATFTGDDTYLAATSESVELLVDATAPTTALSHGPPTLARSRGARLDFVADEPATFSCRLDAGSWQPCASPWKLTGLADGAHTARVRATDMAGNQELAPVVVAWTLDATAPVIDWVSLENGAFATNRAVVDAQVAATDAGSGVTRVRVSNSSAVDASGRLACGTNFPFGPTIRWSLTKAIRCGDGADGDRTVYAQVRDAAGNWSAPVSDDIVLDRTVPRAWLRINAGAATTAWKIVELNPCCWGDASGIAEMRISNSNATVGGVLSQALVIEGWTKPISWNLLAAKYGGSSSIGLKTVYLQLRDGAGNWSGVKKATIQYQP